ncbi:Hypothetical protein MVR_LOCUS73 [uncultured virus]|nr:Hypothetical protein MVR_LOCUS73 [uncultured virus]
MTKPAASKSKTTRQPKKIAIKQYGSKTVRVAQPSNKIVKRAAAKPTKAKALAAPEKKITKAKKGPPSYAYACYPTFNLNQLIDNPAGFKQRNEEAASRFAIRHPKRVERLVKLVRTVPGYAFRAYEYRAYSKCRNFDLSYELFTKLVTSPCHYCGEEYKENLMNVNRLDNRCGYTRANVVPACNMCSTMKNSLDESTFILTCYHVDGYRINKSLRCAPVFGTSNGCSQAKYKKDAVGIKREFTISPSELLRIQTLQKCHLCGMQGTKRNKLSIDRKDNTGHFAGFNVKPCCSSCCSLKGEYDLQPLHNKCSDITCMHKYRIKELGDAWVENSSFTVADPNKPENGELEILRLVHKAEKYVKAQRAKVKAQVDEGAGDLEEQMGTDEAESGESSVPSPKPKRGSATKAKPVRASTSRAKPKSKVHATR